MSNALNDDKKHFTEFFLGNTNITELTENTFSDITFDRIRLNGAINLRRFDNFAFGANSFITKNFEAVNTSLENSLNIFTALSLLKNLETIIINVSNISEVPDNAFRPLVGQQKNLISVDLSSNQIIKVGKNAFQYLTALKRIDLTWNRINNIADNAFSFINGSNEQISILLYHNQINESSIKPSAFNELRRPAKITLDKNNMTTLLYDVFSHFLAADHKNIVSFTNINCSDCRSFWLLKPLYEKQLSQLKCSNQKAIIENGNFMNCKNLLSE